MNALAPVPWAALVVLLPLLASVAACCVRTPRAAAWLAVGGSAAAFACAAGLAWWRTHSWLRPLIDPLAPHVALLTAFVAMTACWTAREGTRAQHALFLALLGALLAAVLADDLAITWVAMEAATLAGAVLIGLARTEAALAAAWRFFILGGVGLALALFGSVLLYLAAVPALGPGLAAMSWSALAHAAPALDGKLVSIGFLFVLVGYGTHAALVPLHSWMPQAEAATPAPVAVLLGGAMLNVALVAILRARAVAAGNAAAMAPGPPLMALGLLSLLFAAFALWRQRETRRGLALVTIGQSGVAAFAFGLGGAAANFAGLLQLTLHTLAKAAAVQSDGPATPARRLTLAAALIALAGLPPFGLFSALFLIMGETARRLPWLLLPLGVGLAVGAWALAARLAALPPGAAERGTTATYLALAPAWLALALVLLLGLAMPGAAVAWFAEAARMMP